MTPELKAYCYDRIGLVHIYLEDGDPVSAGARLLDLRWQHRFLEAVTPISGDSDPEAVELAEWIVDTIAYIAEGYPGDAEGDCISWFQEHADWAGDDEDDDQSSAADSAEEALADHDAQAGEIGGAR